MSPDFWFGVFAGAVVVALIAGLIAILPTSPPCTSKKHEWGKWNRVDDKGTNRRECQACGWPEYRQ